jgi:AraC-like DNA-binding protein
MVYPLFYIYIRLLTVDENFELKKHYKYIVVPHLLFIIYSIGILISPHENYQTLITDYENSPWNFLKIVLISMKITFLIQVILCVTGNTILLKKYKHSAGQYYSDIEDSRIYKAELLNLCIIMTGISSFVLGMLGRDFFLAEPVAIAIASLVFSSLLFAIGLLGNVQKVVNPGYETDSSAQPTASFATEQEMEHFKAEVSPKILRLFDKDKIYLNSKLTIRDVAQIAGTNRTYVSNFINTRFNQNFCSFVNQYRLEELQRTIWEHPEYSINTLKRAVYYSYGNLYSEWRKVLLSKREKTQDSLKAKA